MSIGGHGKVTHFVSGTKLRGVTCHDCRCQYAYVIARVASAQSIDPFCIRNELGDIKARREASVSLSNALQWEVDVVPCPKCELVQPDMVGEARRIMASQNRLLYYLGGACVVAGGLLLFFKQYPLSIGAFLIGMVLMLMNYMKNSRFDINMQPEIRRKFVEIASRKGVLTREELEQIVAEEPDADISDARLDWARQEL